MRQRKGRGRNLLDFIRLDDVLVLFLDLSQDPFPENSLDRALVHHALARQRLCLAGVGILIEPGSVHLQEGHDGILAMIHKVLQELTRAGADEIKACY